MELVIPVWSQSTQETEVQVCDVSEEDPPEEGQRVPSKSDRIPMVLSTFQWSPQKTHQEPSFDIELLKCEDQRKAPSEVPPPRPMMLPLFPWNLNSTYSASSKLLEPYPIAPICPSADLLSPVSTRNPSSMSQNTPTQPSLARFSTTTSVPSPISHTNADPPHYPGSSSRLSPRKTSENLLRSILSLPARNSSLSQEPSSVPSHNGAIPSPARQVIFPPPEEMRDIGRQHAKSNEPPLPPVSELMGWMRSASQHPLGEAQIQAQLGDSALRLFAEPISTPMPPPREAPRFKRKNYAFPNTSAEQQMYMDYASPPTPLPRFPSVWPYLSPVSIQPWRAEYMSGHAPPPYFAPSRMVPPPIADTYPTMPPSARIRNYTRKRHLPLVPTPTPTTCTNTDKQRNLPFWESERARFSRMQPHTLERPYLPPTQDSIAGSPTYPTPRTPSMSELQHFRVPY